MIVEYTVSSLEEALGAVKRVRAAWKKSPTAQEEIWFRGQAEAAQQLVPGLYRPEVMCLGYDEGSMFERFRALASPLVRREPTAWEWYFLMQHHGLCTRLLDWSENLLAAVHFAVSKSVQKHTQRTLAQEVFGPRREPVFDSQSPAVWMIDAGRLNVATCGPGKDYIFVVPSPEVDLYLYEVESRHVSNEKPVAILSPRSNDRIVAQQGCFTIHGWASDPIESLATADTFDVAKLVFDRANLAAVWDDLETCGVHVLSLFPDLDSVAKRIRWICQNERTEMPGSDS